MKRLALLAIAAAAPLLAGCRHYHHTVYHDAVYVPGAAIHYHGPSCGHVYVDGCWVDSGVTVVHTYRECGPRVIVAPVPHRHFWDFAPHNIFRHHR